MSEILTRLTPAEASELAAMLKGRNSWRGVRALARELGTTEGTIRRAIRRVRMRPDTVRRLRFRMAARAVDAVPLASSVGGVN